MQLLCGLSALFIYLIVNLGCDPEIPARTGNQVGVPGQNTGGQAGYSNGQTTQPVSGQYAGGYSGQNPATTIPPHTNPPHTNPPHTNPPHTNPPQTNTVQTNWYDPSQNAGPLPPILIGSFNIQSFGQAKIVRPGVMERIVNVARRFDILAIQELRSKEQDVIPRFLQMLNSDGSRYRASVGKRQGYNDRDSPNRYFEQYVYVYDSEKIELTGPAYVADAPEYVIHRSPYVAPFRTIGYPASQAFSFVLMNVHVDPDDVPTEHDALTRIINGVRYRHQHEDDFILLGDLNDAPRDFHAYPWFSSQYAAIPDRSATNTARTRNMDNIVFDSEATGEYLNQAGVMDLMREFSMSSVEARTVSDHLPVWARFSSYEAQERQPR